MEEPVLMSDEETNDSEIIFVDSSPPPSAENKGNKGQSKVITEEMKIDEQLKELGLFEEGMSMEQKQELLVVLAASRETAEQEESMRQRAMEWERQLFSDAASAFDSAIGDNDQWKSDYSKTAPGTYGRNALLETDADEGPKALSSSKAEETYSEKMKLTESALKMLDDEESSKLSENQDQKSMSTSTISTDLFYAPTSDLSFPGNSARRSGESSQREKHNLLRSAYRPLSPSNSRVAVAHPIIRDSGSEMVIRDEDSSSLSPVDFHRIKFKLEKSMSSWRPCMSPVTFDLACRRATPKQSEDNEYVPFFCPANSDPMEYTGIIVNAFRKYHLLLRKMQSCSKKRIPWGEPIKVGRHHLDTLDALTPRHQVKIRNSERVAARLSNRSNVEVNYAEVESKECNEDSGIMNIDKCPEQNSSDANTVVRTLKSAFRPIKTTLQSSDKENDSVQVSDCELRDECSKSDTLPRSKSYPSSVACNSNSHSKAREKPKRTLLSDLSDKDMEEPQDKDNSLGLCQWSPFGSSSAMLLNNEVPNFNAFGSFAPNKATPSFDSICTESSSTASEKIDVSEIENSVCDSQFHVRKDGQKTYSTRPHHKSEQSFSMVSRTAETCDNGQEMTSGKSQDDSTEFISPAEDSSSSKNDDILLSQIEQGGISRKRKCELRLTRLTQNELKVASPRKRWKKQS